VKTVGSFEAKTHLARLLARAARGESFVITKRGKAMASLVPPPSHSSSNPGDVILDFRKKYAGQLGKFSVEMLKELRDFGRR